MQIETYSKICGDCRGKGFTGYKLCKPCNGAGQVLIVDERQTVRAAVSEFLADVRSKYLGAVRAK
jgi:DnaJ-class molecular chaperone